ncbi:hypothetical protein ACO0OE_001247 [Hanseniaspora uvarum]
MVEGVESSSHFFGQEASDKESENSFDEVPNDVDEPLLSEVVEEHVNKKRKTNKSVSIAGGYTDSYTEKMKEEEQPKKKLEEASIELDILKRMALEKEEMDRILIENSMPHKYFFDGEQEDPQSRLKSYTEFRAMLKLAIMPLSNLEPEVKEMAIKYAIPRIDIKTHMDRIYGYKNDIATLVKTALRTPIYDDEWTDGINIENKIKGWSAEKIVFELMKGQVKGCESTKFVSEMDECTINEFFHRIFEFVRLRNPPVPFNMTRHMAANQYEVDAVTLFYSEDENKPQVSKRKRRRSKKIYEKLWESLRKERNIPNSESKREIAKCRFDSESENLIKKLKVSNETEHITVNTLLDAGVAISFIHPHLIDIIQLSKRSISLRDIVTFTVLNNQMDDDASAFVFERTPHPLLLGFADLVRLKFLVELATHQVLYNQKLIQVMNNAVVFNEKHKLSQREPKNKTLSSPEIYNPSPIFKSRSISTNLPLFKEAFLISLVIPKRIKINDSCFMLNEVDGGLTTMKYKDGSRKLDCLKK